MHIYRLGRLSVAFDYLDRAPATIFLDSWPVATIQHGAIYAGGHMLPTSVIAGGRTALRAYARHIGMAGADGRITHEEILNHA